MQLLLLPSGVCWNLTRAAAVALVVSCTLASAYQGLTVKLNSLEVLGDLSRTASLLLLSLVPSTW
jgi:hypothetical protein